MWTKLPVLFHGILIIPTEPDYRHNQPLKDFITDLTEGCHRMNIPELIDAISIHLKVSSLFIEHCE
ncbi:MAG: hypothetical protein KBF06_00270 [Bacteroidales bacterium]|nr:hypothetical protein [Bacteroidales bacterium]MDI9574115.1 hypothetical protein [Bacteroidota bacterium]MBP9587761.1 hypothetical protein [Bacteroidales bacterium]HNQ59087.1 hypothetical protein [Bacteroidales bacterium]HNU21931.1 hypothetical protein [Bacteroidales bacterium]